MTLTKKTYTGSFIRNEESKNKSAKQQKPKIKSKLKKNENIKFLKEIAGAGFQCLE